MLLTPHALTGLAIAYKVPYPLLALPLAMISHQFLDLIPHDDLGGKGEDALLNKTDVKLLRKGRISLNYRHAIIFGDALVAGTATLYFAIKLGSPILFFACAGLAIWSDLLRAPYFLLGCRHKLFKLVHKIDGQIFHSKEKGAWGKLVQIAVAIVMLAILFDSFPWIN